MAKITVADHNTRQRHPAAGDRCTRADERLAGATHGFAAARVLKVAVAVSARRDRRGRG